MNSIISYAKEETRSIKEFPFNDVDSLILSTLIYLDFSKFVSPLKDHKDFVYFNSINNYDALLTEPSYKRLKINLIKAIQTSPRFQNLKMNYYIDIHDIKNELQFCAITFKLDNLTYIAFRGTDDTLTGWKEDFNMAYKCPVPAQKMAVKYLNQVSYHLGGYLYIGGHSKGGNLAIYSAMHTHILNKFRIKKIYSHDGPGFKKEIYESIPYRIIASKISKTIPTSSIIGLLLYTREQIKIVKSRSFGIFQHSSFNWIVKNSDFIYEETTTKDSKIIDNTISDWLNETTDESRALFINTIFSILRCESIHSSGDILKNWYPYYKSVKNKINKLDPITKKKIDELFKKLLYVSLKNIKETKWKHPKSNFSPAF